MKRNSPPSTPLVVSVVLHGAALAALTMWAGVGQPAPEPEVETATMTVRWQPPQPPRNPRFEPQPPTALTTATAEIALAELRPIRLAPEQRARDSASDLELRPTLAPPTLPALPPLTTPITSQPRPVPRPTAEPRRVTPPPAPTRVTSQEPTLISELRPEYPRECRRRGHEGTVALRLTIDASGNVTDVVITEPARCRHMNAAARATARQLRYLPATEHGKSVAGTTLLRLRFQLAESGGE